MITVPRTTIGGKLPPGTILRVLEAAGIDVPAGGDKRTLRCPLHEDKRPSAVIWPAQNTFHCGVCGGRCRGGYGQAWQPGGVESVWKR